MHTYIASVEIIVESEEPLEDREIRERAWSYLLKETPLNGTDVEEV
jgi:hypothetical protein